MAIQSVGIVGGGVMGSGIGRNSDLGRPGPFSPALSLRRPKAVWLGPIDRTITGHYSIWVKGIAWAGQFRGLPVSAPLPRSITPT